MVYILYILVQCVPCVCECVFAFVVLFLFCYVLFCLFVYVFALLVLPFCFLYLYRSYAPNTFHTLTVFPQAFIRTDSYILQIANIFTSEFLFPSHGFVR